MRAVNRIAVFAGLAGLVLGCAPPRTAYSDLRPLAIAVRFGLENLCSGSQSPPIRVLNAPEATASYRIRITNTSVLLQSPRDWSIPAPSDPALIPFGALDGWTGPCPGDFQRFNYRVEAVALDRGGAAIAYGGRVVPVEPVNFQAQENWRLGGAGTAADPMLPPDPNADFGDVLLYEPGNNILSPRNRPGLTRSGDPTAPGYSQR